MDLLEGSELFQAQSHLYKHVFNYISSMSLKCAVELGIPDIIHNHGRPITLPDLVTALEIHPSKTSFVYRLMSLLVHSGFFAATLPLDKNQERGNHNEEEEAEAAYDLTPSSRLLLKDKLPCLSPLVLTLCPATLAPWQYFGNWLKGDNGTTPFEIAHGMKLWEYAEQNPAFNSLFNEAMASDSGMLNLSIRDCEPVFQGLGSLVDVGGGTGKVCRIISEAFPRLKCTVLDLPHVVANLPDTENVKFIGGDMFHFIPPADAIMLKLILHDYSDEECLKILKKCREAIPSDDGKVIIIDIVISKDREEHQVTETKLCSDISMMLMLTGRERSERDWEKLFLEAGFRSFKILPLLGLRSLIEIYP
ncbi:trans-resveratrol di-O-methyltransferase [Ziziphus jujuba]|uniref:Trans-resveratrol di-O-methyltransferase n=1 Tax=Ziziphus jujuba TaxID=326968 RepID=A0A6P3ZJ09_ZIZJJ|nr:trans-resveratrol di-O-methyltransferase [Ziziphus jujuba]